MLCPHCNQHFHANPAPQTADLGNDNDRRWHLTQQRCAGCGRLILILSGFMLSAATGDIDRGHPGNISGIVYPQTTGRPPCPPEIPTHIAQDYREACLILRLSPKASAALSRRCLQTVLREAAGVKERDLATEIQKVLDAKTLPSHLADNVDAIRQFGNFSAHPIPDTATGAIMPVESGEAEWTIEILESLFDFFYTEPERSKKRRAALNSKLQQAGKPPMK